MKIVAAGVSGFIGSRLTKALDAAGHEVVQLVRRSPGAGQRQWDPDAGELDRTVLDGADAVIDMCGVGVGDKRWTDDYRRLIVSSRVRPTSLLAKACAERSVPVLLNASAVGFYGWRDDEELTESAPAGGNFLAGVTRDWETATTPASDAGTRVVNLRTGLVLGREGGLLPQLKLVTKLFLGGRLGSGRQWSSWIGADDEIGAILFLLTADVFGPVNLTAPHPVTNKEFIAAIGRVQHRPTPWVVPAFALRLVLGDFADEIVHGQRVVPRELLDAGYKFQQPTLAEALDAELK